MYKKLPKKISIIYNSPRSDLGRERSLGDMDTVLTAKEIFEALNSRGYVTELLAVDNDYDLTGLSTDLVFNLCEWTGKETYKSCRVLEQLEKLDVPYTGANARNFFETSEKIIMKKLMDDYGLPTPKWVVLENTDTPVPVEMKYPLIVKLALEHGSLGITQNSVVENSEQLVGQVQAVFKKYNQSILIEEFVAGKELNVTLVGNGEKVRALPVTEMEFGAKDQKWNILTFSSKFLDRTEEYKESHPVYPPMDVDQMVLKRVSDLARRAFVKFDCWDYARVDMRLDTFGKAWILEVNSNPSLENTWISSMVSARTVGWAYEDIIEQIVLAAWKRTHPRVRIHENNGFVQQPWY